MNACLYCYKQLEKTLTWSNWLTVEKIPVLCSFCAGKLEIISGERCERCSREWSGKICLDCQQWRELGDNIEKNYSIFRYNDSIREMISQWKFRGDYILREIFRKDLKNAFETQFAEKHSAIAIVPIPLSEKRMQERGFNQSLALAEMLDTPVKQALARRSGEKQAINDRKTRLKRDNPFYITEPLHQTALIVDDIYTTGTTVRQAAQQLKLHGCPAVYALTVARS
ncbi:ComF family protein [Oceanobacillus jeddahense]|uniref:ComF family protein n=1 Tax=Oceanobacillus jeddahense TaxID=1462527 RepID=A0ABY5JRT5_9BACI|nr:ComF family protein [Oceanobacillus jeddahense]UUI02157.1 ComF family protein [Oceanobacillus jeddahense]